MANISCAKGYFSLFLITSEVGHVFIYVLIIGVSFPVLWVSIFLPIFKIGPYFFLLKFHRCIWCSYFVLTNTCWKYITLDYSLCFYILKIVSPQKFLYWQTSICLFYFINSAFFLKKSFSRQKFAKIIYIFFRKFRSLYVSNPPRIYFFGYVWCEPI